VWGTALVPSELCGAPGGPTRGGMLPKVHSRRNTYTVPLLMLLFLIDLLPDVVVTAGRSSPFDAKALEH